MLCVDLVLQQKTHMDPKCSNVFFFVCVLVWIPCNTCENDQAVVRGQLVVTKSNQENTEV